MSALGRDLLFDRGYLLVRDGTIRHNRDRAASDVVHGYVAALTGKR